MASGGEIVRPTDEVLAHAREQFEPGRSQTGAAVQLPERPACLRLLDERDPTSRH
jgi:hypothetical protein